MQIPVPDEQAGEMSLHPVAAISPAPTAPRDAGADPSAPVEPNNPGDLFIWREPFQPIVPLPPIRPAEPDIAAAGGERPVRDTAIFLGVNLLGDFLCTTPTIRAFRRRNPQTFIAYVVQNATYCRVLEGNPGLDLVLYSDDLYRYGERVVTEEWLRRLPIDVAGPRTLYRFNIHEVCRSHPGVFEEHCARGFARYLSVSIDSVRPVVVTTERERVLARRLVRRPCIVFGMHTTSRVIGAGGDLVLKDWVFER
jgi:hypothetical protein